MKPYVNYLLLAYAVYTSIFMVMRCIMHRARFKRVLARRSHPEEKRWARMKKEREEAVEKLAKKMQKDEKGKENSSESDDANNSNMYGIKTEQSDKTLDWSEEYNTSWNNFYYGNYWNDKGSAGVTDEERVSGTAPSDSGNTDGWNEDRNKQNGNDLVEGLTSQNASDVCYDYHTKLVEVDDLDSRCAGGCDESRAGFEEDKFGDGHPNIDMSSFADEAQINWYARCWNENLHGWTVEVLDRSQPNRESGSQDKSTCMVGDNDENQSISDLDGNNLEDGRSNGGSNASLFVVGSDLYWENLNCGDLVKLPQSVEDENKFNLVEIQSSLDENDFNDWTGYRYYDDYWSEWSSNQWCTSELENVEKNKQSSCDDQSAHDESNPIRENSLNLSIVIQRERDGDESWKNWSGDSTTVKPNLVGNDENHHKLSTNQPDLKFASKLDESLDSQLDDRSRSEWVSDNSWDEWGAWVASQWKYENTSDLDENLTGFSGTKLKESQLNDGDDGGRDGWGTDNSWDKWAEWVDSQTKPGNVNQYSFGDILSDAGSIDHMGKTVTDLRCDIPDGKSPRADDSVDQEDGHWSTDRSTTTSYMYSDSTVTIQPGAAAPPQPEREQLFETIDPVDLYQDPEYYEYCCSWYDSMNTAASIESDYSDTTVDSNEDDEWYL